MNYLVAAAFLKAFSLNSTTRSLYGVAKRFRRQERHIIHERAAWVMDLLPPPQSDRKLRILELGTGWIHAYSLYPALLREDEIHCFDVSDMRYPLAHLKRAVMRAEEQITAWNTVPPTAIARMRNRVQEVLAAETRDDAYRILGITYHVASDGLPAFPAGSMDFIYSIDVLEHVLASAFPSCTERWFSILRPGGRFAAQVGLDDHIAFNDKALGFGTKNYVRYSQRTWHLLLDNDVQYMNRIPASEMLRQFERAGFAIEQAVRDTNLVHHGPVHPDYGWLSQEDLQTVRLNLVARKPV